MRKGEELSKSVSANPSEDSDELARMVSLLLGDMERTPNSRGLQFADADRSGRAEDEANLFNYWHVVRKRLWLIVGITVLITTLVAIFLMRKPDIYEARARVEVDLENANPALSASKNNPVIFNNPVNYPAYFNTQMQILSGSGLLRRVVKTLDLQHDANFTRNLPSQDSSSLQTVLQTVGFGSKTADNTQPQFIEDTPLGESIATTASQSDLKEAAELAPYVEAVQERLKVEPVRENGLSVRETYLIDIIYTHQDRQLAAKVVNAIGDIFTLQNFEKKTHTNTATGDYLQKRITELQTQIRTGEGQLANYAKSHQILSLDGSQNTVVERLAGLNKQLLEAENERKGSEAAYRTALAPGAAAALAEDALKRNDDKQLADIDLKLVELRQRRAQLRTETTEKWPEVQEINNQIAELEKQVQDARNRAASLVVTNLGSHYRQALTHEQSLRTAFDQQRGYTLVQNDAAINYRILQQEIATYKTLLDGLLQRAKENDVVMAGTPNNLMVVDYAIVPRKPVGPKRLLGISVAFALALGFGVGFAFVLEYLDDTVRSVEDIEDTLRLPTIGVIPSAEAVARRRLLPRVGGSPPINGDLNPELILAMDVRSPLAEAYRQLRTSVLISTAGRAPKSLLVTSSQPSEGKTTTAVNIAISLAQTGASVVVVDADMRRPRLHSIFKMGNQRGLSAILSSNMSDADVLSMVERQEATGLYTLTSGPIPPNPAELIGSEQMPRLIELLESTFTHVVIDSPPIVSFTDGVLISSMVDGVLLVVHEGRTSRHIVKRSRQLLQDVGAKIFGVVLNNVNLRSHNYGYYSNYYQQPDYDEDETGVELATGRR